MNQVEWRATLIIAFIKLCERAIRLSVRLRLSCLLLFIAMSGAIVHAETVNLVKDINTHATWRVSTSVSNGVVAFHEVSESFTGPTTLWRSTALGTERIELTEIENAPGKHLTRMFLSDSYLYLQTSDRSLYQMTLDGQQLTEVTKPEGDYSFHSPIFSDESNIAYFLQDRLGSARDGIYLFRLDEQSASITRVGDQILDRIYYFTGVRFINGRIVFIGGNAVWSIDTSGEDIRKVKTFARGTTGRENPVFGQSLMYFAFLPPNQRVRVLWSSDGTLAGTRELTTLPVDRLGQCASEMVSIGENRMILSKLYRRPNRAEIWETNGTPDTTRLISELRLSQAQLRLNLTRAGDHIWYRRTTNSGRSVIYVTDLVFSSSRRVMARPADYWVRFFPLSEHMLIRFSNYNTTTRIRLDNNGSSLFKAENDGLSLYNTDDDGSSLFKADEDGSNLSVMYRGVNYLYAGQVAEFGAEVILPLQTKGEPRELLVAVNLNTKQRSVRARWRDTNASSGIQPRFVEGPDESVYFCAMGLGRRVVITSFNGVKYSQSNPQLWRADSEASSIDRVVSKMDLSLRPRNCGEFAAGTDKIYYSLEADLGPGPPQSELWSANLDGGEQKLFINITTTPENFYDESSSPRNIFTLAGGGVLYTAQIGSFNNTKRSLVRGYDDGSYEFIGDQRAIVTEIIGQTGDKYWIRTADKPADADPIWSLWMSDGSPSGTRQVARGMYANSVVEVDGDTWFTGEFRQDPRRRDGLYKVSAGEFRPTFVMQLPIQRDLDACCSADYQLSDYITQLRDFDGDIVYLQKNYTGQPTNQLRRVDIETREDTVLFDSPIMSGRIKSSAVFNGHIYVFKEKFVDRVTVPDWEIWRSSGAVRDATMIHRQDGESKKIGLFHRTSHGMMKATPSAIWFFAGDKRLGNELWRLTP